MWKPHVTVAAVIEREGRFLMVEEESEGRIVYNQPAGHLDEGEGLITAAIRETLEETAWRFEPSALVGLYRWRHPQGKTYLRACFSGACHGHDPSRTLDTGILRAVWLTRDELLANPAHLRSPLVMRCVDDYLAGKRYPLEIIGDLHFDEDKRDAA
ncbi:MAG: NUDIX hydrolase [Gammaproteobacteria bacterium]|nr:NUDIX hydrolase [Gammaproteobacteria bacterium]